MRGPVASIVLMLLLVAPPIRANEAEDAALLHLERGVAAFRAGDYARAHRELEAAQELAPHKPNPYRWLALTEIQLGDCSRALVNIEGFLSRVPPAEPRVAELVRLRQLCRRTGALTVHSSPPRVSLRIDGVVVGVTPYRALSMRAGRHRLVAEKPDFEPASRSIVVQAGSELGLHLQLSRRDRPVTRRWWFWPAVVGSAAAITGLVLVVAGRPDDRTVLPPVRCDATGCAPGGA